MSDRPEADTPESVDAKMERVGGIVGQLLEIFAPNCFLCGARMRVVGRGLANLVYACDHDNDLAPIRNETDS